MLSPHKADLWGPNIAMCLASSTENKMRHAANRWLLQMRKHHSGLKWASEGSKKACKTRSAGTQAQASPLSVCSHICESKDHFKPHLIESCNSIDLCASRTQPPPESYCKKNCSSDTFFLAIIDVDLSSQYFDLNEPLVKCKQETFVWGTWVRKSVSASGLTSESARLRAGLTFSAMPKFCWA